MPFFGSDWRAPGDKWIHTEFGWKRLSEIQTALQKQIGRVASSISPAVKRSTGKLRSGSESPGSSLCPSRVSSRSHSPVKVKTYYVVDEQPLTLLQQALGQRCISARRSLRESNNNATLSDAVNKLNFSQGIHDMNLFPFICEVMELVFEQYYWTLSGSMQTILMRITQTAKDIAIERKQLTGYILSSLEKQLITMEKGRSQLTSGFSVSRLDSKIKNLRVYRTQLLGQFEECKNDYDELPFLPNDCWRHIISFLSHPKDLLHLGCVNRLLYILVKEDHVWKSLTEYHFGNNADISKIEGSGMEFFKEMYWSSGKNLKTTVFSAVVHCGICDRVYWWSYNHPCTALGDSSVGNTASNNRGIKYSLTAHQFIALFQS